MAITRERLESQLKDIHELIASNMITEDIGKKSLADALAAYLSLPGNAIPTARSTEGVLTSHFEKVELHGRFPHMAKLEMNAKALETIRTTTFKKWRENLDSKIKNSTVTPDQLIFATLALDVAVDRLPTATPTTLEDTTIALKEAESTITALHNAIKLQLELLFAMNETSKYQLYNGIIMSKLDEHTQMKYAIVLNKSMPAPLFPHTNSAENDQLVTEFTAYTSPEISGSGNVPKRFKSSRQRIEVQGGEYWEPVQRFDDGTSAVNLSLVESEVKSIMNRIRQLEKKKQGHGNGYTGKNASGPDNVHVNPNYKGKNPRPYYPRGGDVPDDGKGPQPSTVTARQTGNF